MNREIYRQRAVRALQSIALVGALVFLAARAVSVLFGPVAGWTAALLSAAVVGIQVRNGGGFIPAGARPLAAYEASQLTGALRELAERAGLERVPRLYYLDRPEALAFTTGFGGNASILVSRGLLLSLPFREILAVLGHEIAHIRNHDLALFAVVSAIRRLTRTVAAILTTIVLFTFPLLLLGVVAVPPNTFLYIAVIPLVSLLAQLALLRTREFQADIGAVELTGDPEALARALEHLDAPGPGWGRSDRIAEMFRTHPSTRERIARLRSFAPKRAKIRWISA